MSSSTDPRFPIGYISRAHGLAGEVVVVSDSDDDRFAVGTTFLTDEDETLTVAGARMGKHGRIVLFAEVAERNGAEALRGRTLTIGEDQRRDLDATEYWPEQLVGLAVVTEQGVEAGVVTAVIFGEAQDRLVIDGGRRIAEVPFVDELVPEVDLEHGRLVVRPIEGLLSAEES